MCYIMYRIYSNRIQAKKNNFKSGLRTIRVKTIPGSEFSSVNYMLHCNRSTCITALHDDRQTNSGYQWYRTCAPGPDHHEGSLRKAL